MKPDRTTHCSTSAAEPTGTGAVGHPIGRRAVLSAAGMAGVLGLAGCVPGSTNGSAGTSSGSPSARPVSTDVASAGPVTLTVWDQNTDGGIAVAQKQLNAQFTAKYPNVRITRVSRSFADLKTTLKLALSGNDAPDVVQANQGYPDMGAFVQARLLAPLGSYADLYSWSDRYPADLLSLNSFTSDGATWRQGELYGISQTGEIVGVYYNKKLLAKAGVAAPTTMTAFRAALPRVKAAGLLPIQYGDASKSPGIHLYGAVISAVAGEKAASDLVSGAGGAWTDPDPLQAATIVHDWATRGYLPEGANGVSGDDAVASFAGGEGAFFVSGTWQLATVSQGLGADGGFVALQGRDAKPETLGGVGLAWAMTSKTAHPDVAAAYIDFVTNAASSKVLIYTGNLPVVLPPGYAPPTGTVNGDIVAQWRQVSQKGGLVPYLDYATPTFYDTLSGAVQQLTGGRATPQQFATMLQTDYAAFEKGR